jgi:hypothetical protein
MFGIFDETGLMMDVIQSGTGMVITSSERLGRPKSVQPGNREWITVIQAINAEGRAIEPFIIGAGQYHLANWHQEATLPDGWIITTSQNCWTKDELGLEWLTHVDYSSPPGLIYITYWLLDRILMWVDLKINVQKSTNAPPPTTLMHLIAITSTTPI